MHRVPFIIDDVHGGMSEAQGLLYLEDGDDPLLVFEVHLKTLYLFPQPPEVIKAGLNVIDALWLKGSKLLIQTRSLNLRTALPGSHTKEIVLKVKRRDRKAATALIDTVVARKFDVGA